MQPRLLCRVPSKSIGDLCLALASGRICIFQCRFKPADALAQALSQAGQFGAINQQSNSEDDGQFRNSNLSTKHADLPKERPTRMPSGARFAYVTTNGRIMSCSSCSRMWQCHTYSWPPVRGLKGIVNGGVGSSNFMITVVTSP